MPRPTRKRYRNVTKAVFTTPWAILPDKLAEICEVIELRSRGQEFTREEIRERVGVFDRPQDRTAAGRGGQVAVLNLFGTITHRANMLQEFSGGTSTEIFSKAFQAAVEDGNVSAIVINADTPGGTVPGVPELSEQIYNSRGTKPIITVVNPMMCSAGYWIGSAADEIVAVPSAIDIGSLGVVNVHSETSQMDEKLGVRNTVIRSVSSKALVNSFEPLTAEGRDFLQSRVDEIHTDFIAAIARNRGMSVAEVEAKFPQSPTFMAAGALQIGMVDRIATLETVLAELGVAPGSQSRVAATVSTRPIFAMGESWTMDKQVFQQLIRLGLCDLDDNEATANVALRAYLTAGGHTTIPSDPQEILRLLQPKQSPAATLPVAPPTQPTAPATAPATIPAGRTNPSGMAIADIMGMIKTARLPAETALALQTELVAQASDLTVAQVVARVDAAAQQYHTPAGHVPIETVAAATDKFHAAARDAILTEAFGSKPPAEIFDTKSQEFVAWKPAKQNYGLSSFSGIASETLRQCGVSQMQLNRLSKPDIARIVMGKPLRDFGIVASSDGPAYNTSGMFSNIVYDAANVASRGSYREVNTTFQAWSKQGASLTDFKPVHKIIAGELSDPKAIPEDGEFEETTLTDGRESYKLTVWGEVFSITWQTVVNDQLGAFMEIPMKQGRAMRRKQNKLVYGVLKDNAALSDGVALFDSSTHNNLTTGSATPTVATLNAMLVKMATQTGLNADATLNITPRYILSGWALWGTILELLGSTANPAAGGSAAGSSGVKNIWQNSLTPITDAELGAAQGGSDTAWHLLADANDVDTVEYAYLQGLETPALDQETAFDRLAMRFRIYQAFATKALDYRGMQKHAGA